MAVWEDVNAILEDDTKTVDVKRQQVIALKATALNDQLRSSAFLNKTVTFDSVNYTVRSVNMVEDRGLLTLRVVVSAVHTITGAVLLSSKDVHVIINPPIYPKSGAKDLLQVAKEVLSNLLPRAGGII